MNFLRDEKRVRLCKMAGILLAAAVVAAYGVLGIWKHVPGLGDYFHGVIIVTLILGMLMSGVLGYLLIYRRCKIERLYPIAALFLAVMVFLALPTYSKPDEPQHFETAYELSNRMLGIDVAEGEFGFIINRRQCDTIYQGTELSVEQYNRFGQTYVTDEEGLSLVECYDNISTKEILPYVVPALGIALGRILHLGFGGIAALGTLFSSLFFILMITYALHKIPYGKRMLFVVALLPMTLQQANSFSYDCSLIAAGVVVTALALRWRYQPIRKPELLMLAVSALLLLSVKGAIYSPLLLCPLLAVMMRRYGQRRGEKKVGNSRQKKVCVFVLAAVVLAAAAAVFWLLQGGTERLGSFLARRYYIEWADAYGFSVMDYLTHPLETVQILWNTVLQKGGYYIITALGGLLGWIDITISRKVMLIIAFLLMLSLIRTKDDCTEKEEDLLQTGERCVSVLISLGVCILCVLSMLVYWTPMFSETVEGAQGRYFLPVLPVLLLGIGFWKKPVIRHSLDGFFAAAMPLADFAVILCIYINIVTK